jgi:hypothetical protein
MSSIMALPAKGSPTVRSVAFSAKNCGAIICEPTEQQNGPPVRYDTRLLDERDTALEYFLGNSIDQRHEIDRANIMRHREIRANHHSLSAS